MTTLTPARQRHVESVFLHRSGAWTAPFTVRLTDTLVHAFYDDDDYEDIRQHLTATYGTP
jgi:hypothetical protein